jgi:hypothetical protein
MFYLLSVFIYVYWCQTPFLYQIICMSFNSNTTGVTNRTGIVYSYKTTEFTMVYSRVRFTKSLVFYQNVSTIFKRQF